MTTSEAFFGQRPPKTAVGGARRDQSYLGDNPVPGTTKRDGFMGVTENHPPNVLTAEKFRQDGDPANDTLV
jgi:hypothetical protein